MIVDAMTDRLSDTDLSACLRADADWVWGVDQNLDCAFCLAVTAQAQDLAVSCICEAVTLGTEDQPEQLRQNYRLTHRLPFRDFVHTMADCQGRIHNVRSSALPLLDADGIFRGYRGTTSLLAARQRWDRQQFSTHVLRQNALAESNFLALMSHELLTPLNAVIGFADLLLADEDKQSEPTRRYFLQTIHDSGQHLAERISDILDYVRLTNGSLKLQNDSISPADAVEHCVANHANYAASMQVQLINECPIQAPMLQADQRGVRHALTNLIINAIRFSQKGGDVRISLGDTADGGLSIIIRDTGIGMSPELLSRIANPTHELHLSQERSTQGIGLGLAICQGIMALHGGSLALESQLNQGTTASLIFPPHRVGKPRS